MREKSLNESPSKKEGKWLRYCFKNERIMRASMKAPPRRKGNTCKDRKAAVIAARLNESPSKKEGKFGEPARDTATPIPPQ